MIKQHRKKILILSLLGLLQFLIISQFYNNKSEEIVLSKVLKNRSDAEGLKRRKDSMISIRIVHSEIEELFSKAVDVKGFNGSVLVAKKGEVLFSKEYGNTNFSDTIKLTEHSAFQLASVSKQFTTVAIMMLVDQKLISVDDSIICYYPDFPYKNITIRHLLNHTSGLPMYFWLAENKWNNKVPPSNSEMMDLLTTEKLLPYFWPGRRFDYSNTGYMVLSSLVEKVSEIPFKEFVTKNIFDPLEMHDSYVYRYTEDSISTNHLTGFRRRGRRRYGIGGTVNDRITGDKNIYSTTHDLLKWIEGLNSGKLISEESLEAMYTKGATKRGREIPYGFGFRIVEDDHGKLIYHNGRWNGFRTTIRQFRESEIVVVVLENSSYRGISSLANEMQHIVNENYCL